MHAVVPCGANEPATQGVQTGAAPLTQAQLLSSGLRMRVPGAPDEPEQVKRIDVVAMAGAAGVLTA